MSDSVAALGLAFAIEGALYALFPAGMKTAILSVAAADPATLRTGGLVAAAAGVGLVWLART